MNAMLKPTSLALVGVAFLLICLYAQAGMAWPDSPRYPESLKPIEEFHSDFIHNEHSRQILDMKPPSLITRGSEQNERIVLKGSHSKSLVQDVKAIDTEKQRDIIYNDIQEKGSGSQDQSNFMDIQVQGDQDGKNRPINDFDDENAEGFMGNAQYDKSTGHQSTQNYMNIDVSGITVSAINTIEGGSAVATSNIIIKPVQVIACPSEVDEKLK